MGVNQFLQPESIHPDIEDVAKRLAQVSGFFPATAQTDTESHYGEPETDGRSVQEALLLRTAVVCVAARVLAFSEEPPTLDSQLLLDMHRGIFEPIYGERTLDFRRPPLRGDHVIDDGVVYPVWVKRGATPELVARHGARANQVAKRVRKTCEAFELAVPHALGNREEQALTLAQLYVRLIRIHPFVDGNGRTAWAALQFAAGRLGVPLVQSTPNRDARLALGDAIRHGNRIQGLADHIANAAWGQ